MSSLNPLGKTKVSPILAKRGKPSPKNSGLIQVKLPDLAVRTYQFLENQDKWVRRIELWKVARSKGYSEEEIRDAFTELEDLGKDRGYAFINFARMWTKEEGSQYRVYKEDETTTKGRQEAFKWFDSLPEPNSMR